MAVSVHCVCEIFLSIFRPNEKEIGWRKWGKRRHLAKNILMIYSMMIEVSGFSAITLFFLISFSTDRNTPQILCMKCNYTICIVVCSCCCYSYRLLLLNCFRTQFTHLIRQHTKNCIEMLMKKMIDLFAFVRIIIALQLILKWN